MENTFKPRCCGIWNVLSKEQLNFAEIINEFIDDARAAAATRITVHLVQTDTDEFSLEVTDDGYGMAREDFDQIFSVGALRGALAYKRCGMGLKVALANADPENLSWEIRTKTTNGECSYIGAPYAEQMAFESLNPKELKSLRRSGAIISSMLSRSVFERGLEGTESDEERIAMLVEILRVTYAPLLPKEQQEEEDSHLSIQLLWTPLLGQEQAIDLTALSPIWAQQNVGYDRANIVKHDSEVYAQYTFGKINPMPENWRFYRGDRKSAGLMVYLHGRLVQYGIFSEIWNCENPRQNDFLFVVNLDGVVTKLPLCNGGKTQLKIEDTKVHDFLRWVQQTCPEPLKG